jgi:hypothetical protein
VIVHCPRAGVALITPNFIEKYSPARCPAIKRVLVVPLREGWAASSMTATLAAASVTNATSATITEIFAIGYRVSPFSESTPTDRSGTGWRNFKSRTIVVWLPVAGVHSGPL